MSNGTLSLASEKKTAEMMHIASHPSDPWMGAEVYNYPKSSPEEYASNRISTIRVIARDPDDFVSSKKDSKPVAEKPIDWDDNLIKHLASKVKSNV